MPPITVRVHTGGTSPHFPRPSRRGIFRNPRGLKYYYAFAEGGISGGAHVYKSSDGVTWSKECDLLGGTVQCTVGTTFYEDAGNTQLVVYVVYAEKSDNWYLKYQRGVIADAGHTISWDAVQTIHTGGTVPTKLPRYFDANICLGVQSGAEYVYITFKKEYKSKGVTYEGIYIIATTTTFPTAAPTWSADEGIKIVSVAGGEFVHAPSVKPLTATEDVLVIYIYKPAGIHVFEDLSGTEKSWDGSSWTTGTEDRIEDITSATEAARHAPSVVDENNKVNVLCSYLPFHFVQWTVASGWGAESGMPSVSGIYHGALALGLDTTVSPNILYAFFVYNDNREVIHVYSSPVDTINWTKVTSFTSECAITNGISVSETDIEGSLHFGCFWISPAEARYYEVSLPYTEPDKNSMIFGANF